MDEIEQGNEVIYKAAGDDADIIFGWVCKEEMNEAVSYTVIATGFTNQNEVTPSATTNNVVTPKVVETAATKNNNDIPITKVVGAENISYINVNQDDLNVPAFLRNQSGEPLKSSGFKVEYYPAEEETSNYGEQDFHLDEEEDRTFLKRMMD